MASYLKIISVVDYLLLCCISVLCVQLDLLRENICYHKIPLGLRAGQLRSSNQNRMFIFVVSPGAAGVLTIT